MSSIDKILKEIILKSLSESKCDETDKEELSVEQQKCVLENFIAEFPNYKNPFAFGDSVISNPDKPKYKWPNKNRPGIVVSIFTGNDSWSNPASERSDVLKFEDTLIAIVDKDDGDVLFYKVDSRYMIKA